MQQIFKYPLAFEDHQEIMMPTGAHILSAQLQGNRICLWARVNSEAPPRPREISIYGTGHPLRDYPGTYINTIQTEGSLVFHVYDRGSL